MIGIVIGTRPELIKLRPVALELFAQGIPCKILYTHQHEAIADEVAALSLQISNGTRSYTFKPIGAGFDRTVTCVVVQGDTDSALHGALEAGFKQIPVVHVEAGLRTVLRDVLQPVPCRSPFPEELNRQLISRVAALHLTPTYLNECNLISEHVGGRIAITGNPGITALHQHLANRRCAIEPEPVRRSIILVTCHRRENWPHLKHLVETELQGIVDNDLIDGRRIIFVKHPNKRLYDDVTFKPSQLHVHEPASHEVMTQLLLEAELVVTDSGGLIEEATWLRKRRLCLRTETERPEAGAPIIEAIDGCHKDILRALDQPEPSEGSRYAFGDERSATNCAREIAAFYKGL